jgi:hypothetical protein
VHATMADGKQVSAEAVTAAIATVRRHESLPSTSCQARLWLHLSAHSWCGGQTCNAKAWTAPT